MSVDSSHSALGSVAWLLNNGREVFQGGSDQSDKLVGAIFLSSLFS